MDSWWLDIFNGVPHKPKVCKNELLELDQIYQALPRHLHIA